MVLLLFCFLLFLIVCVFVVVAFLVLRCLIAQASPSLVKPHNLLPVGKPSGIPSGIRGRSHQLTHSWGNFVDFIPVLLASS